MFHDAPPGYPSIIVNSNHVQIKKYKDRSIVKTGVRNPENSSCAVSNVWKDMRMMIGKQAGPTISAIQQESNDVFTLYDGK